MSQKDKLYDVRVVDRYINEGMLKEKDYQGYIKKLPDVAEKGQVLVIDEEEIPADTEETEVEEESTEDQEGTEIE